MNLSCWEALTVYKGEKLINPRVSFFVFTSLWGQLWTGSDCKQPISKTASVKRPQGRVIEQLLRQPGLPTLFWKVRTVMKLSGTPMLPNTKQNNICRCFVSEDGSSWHRDEPASALPFVLGEETALHSWALTPSHRTFIMGQACKERKMVPRDAQDEKLLSHSAVSDSLWFHGLQPTRLLCPWDFSRQGYWSELPFPSPGDFPDPGVEPGSPALQADSLSSEPPGKPKMRKHIAEASHGSTQVPGGEAEEIKFTLPWVVQRRKHEGLVLWTQSLNTGWGGERRQKVNLHRRGSRKRGFGEKILRWGWESF